MADDIITRIIPQDGWSPIICHRVPIVQTISNIVGDKGPGEIYEGGRIVNFHAKIDWQDQYGGSRVPADVISESSEDNGETWVMNDLQEHEEGSFELDYEGHERDFEVRLNGTSLYIRYRWLMNGQEIVDASGSLEHTITVTDYPVKLEIDARYADNYGGHEIGSYTFNSSKITYKSGAVDTSKTAGAFTKPVMTGANAVHWADKDGWQTQTWSYTENGRTVTAQVGARITALRDVALDVEIDPVYTWGNEESKKYWCISRPSSDVVEPFTFVQKYTYTDYGGNTQVYNIYKLNIEFQSKYVDESDMSFITWADIDTVSEAVSSSFDTNFYLKEYWDEYDLTTPLKDNTLYFEIEDSLIEKLNTFINSSDMNTQLCWYDEENVANPITFGSTEQVHIFREGYVISKSDLRVTVTKNDGSAYVTQDYWMPNNYALGKNKQSITVQKGSLAKTLPATVAYTTKVEVGNGGNFLTFITKTDDYDLFRVDIDIPDGVDCISVEDEGIPYSFSLCTKSDLEDQGVDSFTEDGKYYITFYEEDKSFESTQEWYWGDSDLNNPISNGGFVKSSFYEYGEYVEPTHYKAYYECYDGTEGFDEVEEISGKWQSKVKGALYNLKSYNFYAPAYIEDIYEEGVVGDFDIDEDYHYFPKEGGPLIGNEWKWWTVFEMDNIGDVSFGTFEGGWNWPYRLNFYEKDYIDQPPYIPEDAKAWMDDDHLYLIVEKEAADAGGYPEYLNIVTWERGLFDFNQSSLYCLNEDWEWVKLPNICGEYGSDVGILTLGNKTYKYRVGLEPIDEENYLFIKDFKDKPFDYSLVKCYEPQWEEPFTREAKYSAPYTSSRIFYAYPVEAPSEDIQSISISLGGGEVPAKVLDTNDIVVDKTVLGAFGITAEDDWYLILENTPSFTSDRVFHYLDGTKVTFIEE